MKSKKVKAITIYTVFLLVLSAALAMAPVIASEEYGSSRTGTVPVSYSTLDLGKTAITIDGNPSDWGSILPIVDDSDVDGGGGDYEIKEVYATDDGTNLYLRMDLASIGVTNIYFDLDVDENINTGYNTNTDIYNWYLNPHDNGIDYWIHVDTDLGTAGLDSISSDGTITPIGAVPVGIGSVIEVAVPLSSIGESAPPGLNMDFQTFYYDPKDEAPDTGNAHYPSGPTISIYTDKPNYDTGDTMYLGLDIKNPGSALTACVAVWLENPSGSIIAVPVHAHTANLPAGLNYSNPNFMVFTLPSIPPGSYTWHAAIMDPPTHSIISKDTAQWEFGVVEGEKWAVIVGNADYDGTGSDLQYTDDDAYDMYNALITHGWQADHIALLIDADRTTIVNGISWLASNAGSSDTALFFFSGHGTYGSDIAPYDEADGLDEYICPTDFNHIRDDELDMMLDAVNSDGIAVIIDSCFSGGIAKSSAITTKTIPKAEVEIIDGFGKDVGEEGRVVLMACDEGELSYENGVLQNGVFSYYIVEGLNGAADSNSNDEVSGEEAFNYANPLVVSYMGGIQNPQLYDGYTGELAITTLVKSVFKPASLDFQ